MSKNTVNVALVIVFLSALASCGIPAASSYDKSFLAYLIKLPKMQESGGCLYGDFLLGSQQVINDYIKFVNKRGERETKENWKEFFDQKERHLSGAVVACRRSIEEQVKAVLQKLGEKQGPEALEWVNSLNEARKAVGSRDLEYDELEYFLGQSLLRKPVNVSVHGDTSLFIRTAAHINDHLGGICFALNNANDAGASAHHQPSARDIINILDILLRDDSIFAETREIAIIKHGGDLQLSYGFIKFVGLCSAFKDWEAWVARTALGHGAMIDKDTAILFEHLVNELTPYVGAHQAIGEISATGLEEFNNDVPGLTLQAQPVTV